MLQYSDHEIVQMIKGESSRTTAIAYIYHLEDLKAKVNAYVMKNGGNAGESLDIFHDGIVVLDRNIRNGKYRAESSIEGYLYSICRFIWNNKVRKNRKIISGDNEHTASGRSDDSPEISLFAKEQKVLLQKILDLLDDKCRDILKLWKLSYSMQEIAEKLSISNSNMAKKYRYRCMKKLVICLRDRPDLVKSLKHG